LDEEQTTYLKGEIMKIYKTSAESTEIIQDKNGERYFVLDGLGHNRCRECAFNSDTECLSDDFGVPDCENREDGRTVLYKRAIIKIPKQKGKL
jgi:hypothetical protein